MFGDRSIFTIDFDNPLSRCRSQCYTLSHRSNFATSQNIAHLPLSCRALSTMAVILLRPPYDIGCSLSADWLLESTFTQVSYCSDSANRHAV